MELNEIDIKENYIKQIDENLLSMLLKDRSSGKNIIWATDNYASFGAAYDSQQQITAKLIAGRFGKVIRPRIDKSKKEQQHRIKDKAEVFTPSWICNNQNNLVDNSWFGRENVFNTENGKTWITNNDKITFPEGKTWQDYVKSNRMEISCGEAPYLASRYDTTTRPSWPPAWALETTTCHSSLAKYVPDLIDYTNNNKLIDFAKPIDEQLYSLIDLKENEINYINSKIK